MKKFRGCLQGAVIGDCLGGIHDSSGSLHSFAEVAAKADPSSLKSKLFRAGDRHVFRFSGDTIAIMCSANSILTHPKDLDSMRKNFEQCLIESFKGRGSLKKAVSTSMVLSNLENDVAFDAAKFNLQGNCGVVRAIPSGLVNPQLATLFSGTTHSHANATNGALILAQMISSLCQNSTDFNTLPYPNFHAKLAAVRAMAADSREELEETHELQEKFLRKFGSNSSAIVAISSGYFGFLRALSTFSTNPEFEIPAYLKDLRAQDRSKNLHGNSNRLDSSKALDRETAVIQEESPVAIAINWAISLGGDTRSNACIAGALAGSFWGEDQIPDEWQMYCEGTDDARSFADQLYAQVNQ
jgi:ADP-ribosylglycohydrolase